MAASRWAHKEYTLRSAEGLRLHNVTIQPATLHGKEGLRLTLSDDHSRRLESMTPEERAKVQAGFAWIEKLDFSNGVKTQQTRRFLATMEIYGRTWKAGWW